jgi:hypothetical protein
VGGTSQTGISQRTWRPLDVSEVPSGDELLHVSTLKGVRL